VNDRKQLMASVRTVVVKLGTNVLTRASGEMALGEIHAIIEDLADLQRADYRVLLVSSGAVSMGVNGLKHDGVTAFLTDKQAYAAVGQIRLMAIYQQAFANFNVPTGQILLTEDDFKSRTRYLNLRNTMNRLLDFGVLPIINENDSVSTSEIEESRPSCPDLPVFGDNDVLSALVASKLGADLLLLLTDVDGLYPDGPPPSSGVGSGADDKEAPRPLSLVDEITPEIEAMARAGSRRGRGGMASKLRAVQVAVQSGSPAVIASGHRVGTIPDVLSGADVGTLFLPRRRLASRKRWIAFASTVSGRIVVNQGAYDALTHRGKSLLFAGVVRLEGEFGRGDVVSIVDPAGKEFARGIANYNSEEARPLAGKRSDEITELVGHNYEELIHRDNLVVRDSST